MTHSTEETRFIDNVIAWWRTLAVTSSVSAPGVNYFVNNDPSLPLSKGLIGMDATP